MRALLPLLLVSGCVFDEGPRLPCGATGSYDNQSSTVYDYVYGYDDAGNLTSQGIWLGDEEVSWYEARYDRRELVYEELFGEWSYEVELVDGHRARAVFSTATGSEDYIQAWQWDGDVLVSWQTDYAGGAWDLDATITYEDGGFVEVIDDGVRVRTGFGTGEYDHWTLFEEDLSPRGGFERVTSIEYDDQGLMLAKEYRTFNGIEVLPSERLTYDRDADGSPRAFIREILVDLPSTWRLTYTYCD